MVTSAALEHELETAGERWHATLAGVHARIGARFRRGEARTRVRRYLEGLLAAVERKNGWQLAEHLGDAGPQGVQRLLNAADWDADAVRDDLRAFLVEELSDPAGVLIIDETGFLKKGTKSAGVARQYSGTAGRRENQQIGVFLAYATPRGTAFVDRALYLPESWAEDKERRAEAGIPTAVTFATKGALAQTMLAGAFAAGVPAAWIVGDAVYGHEELRHWLEEQGRNYVLAVPLTHGIWTGGEQVEAQTLADQLPEAAWSRLSAGDGSQGPRWYAWACLALPYPAAPGKAHWLLVRRSLSEPTERAYYRVYGPATASVADMVRVAGSRWAIEVGFEEAKGLVGLDQYEVRKWHAWYRHVTLVLLAYATLVVTRCHTTTAAAAAEKGGAVEGSRLSVAELQRLVRALEAEPAERQHRLRWSAWRRAHQATASRGHRARRAKSMAAVPAPLPLVVPVVGTPLLTEALWSGVLSVLPPPAKRGRPQGEARPMVEGLLWMMHTGAAWREIPAAHGPWQTLYSRYQRWRKAGIWAQICGALFEESTQRA